MTDASSSAWDRSVLQQQQASTALKLGRKMKSDHTSPLLAKPVDNAPQGSKTDKKTSMKIKQFVF